MTRPALTRSARQPATPPDESVPWNISGSRLLREAAAASGPNVSAFVDAAVRAELLRRGVEPPPPLPPKKNGPRRA